MNFCPYCHSVTGQIRSGRNSQGNQRFSCSACGRRYVEGDAREYSSEVRSQVLAALENKGTVRGVAAKFGVGVATVSRWKKSHGRAAEPDAQEVPAVAGALRRESQSEPADGGAIATAQQWLEDA